jgi:hypothetical protein
VGCVDEAWTGDGRRETDGVEKMDAGWGYVAELLCCTDQRRWLLTGLCRDLLRLCQAVGFRFRPVWVWLLYDAASPVASQASNLRKLSFRFI